MKPQLLRIGDTILHLAHVLYIEIKGVDETTLYVHLTNGEALEFFGDRGAALVSALNSGYMSRIYTEAEQQDRKDR